MTLAQHFGLTPPQADALSVRDVAVMLAASRARERAEVWRVGTLLDGMAAYAGLGGRSVEFGHHYRALTGEAGPERVTAEERARLREKAAAHRALRARLRGEA